MVMSNVFSEKILTARMTNAISLSGKLQRHDGLVGHVSTAAESQYPIYDGTYDIKPDVEGQVLETKDKRMANNLNVQPIPFYEVRNQSNGETIVIGGELIWQ